MIAPRSPWLRAVLYAWLIVSTAGASLLVIPRVVPANRLATVVPVCERVRREGLPCSACGLTRSFYAMAQGDTAAARAWNGHGPAIYNADLLNSLAAAAVSVFCLIRGRF